MEACSDCLTLYTTVAQFARVKMLLLINPFTSSDIVVWGWECNTKNITVYVVSRKSFRNSEAIK